MTEQGMSRGEWIRWLGEAISTECEKPFEEIDYDFVEECGRLLDELMESTSAIPTEELRERLAKVNSTAGSGSDKKTAGSHRRLWTVAIAVAVVLCMSITVLAVPQLRNVFKNVLQLDIGNTMDVDGVTYIHYGKTSHYKDMDDLIDTENLNILSFEDPQGELRVKTIMYMEDTHSTIIGFNDETISYWIYHDSNVIDDLIIKNSQKHSYNDYDVYTLLSQFLKSILKKHRAKKPTKV